MFYEFDDLTNQITNRLVKLDFVIVIWSRFMENFELIFVVVVLNQSSEFLYQSVKRGHIKVVLNNLF